jgi:hypothetical protein
MFMTTNTRLLVVTAPNPSRFKHSPNSVEYWHRQSGGPALEEDETFLIDIV